MPSLLRALPSLRLRCARWRTAAALALLLAAPVAFGQGATPARDASDPEASPVWQKVRQSLFQQRPIASGRDDVIVLDAPARAEDAAVVPIAIHAAWPQTAARQVRQVTLVIDNNPSPVAAVFRFTPQSGRADIETRVRIDDYTHVRAIAETSDGELHMSSRFVKASGGCSAPPGKDAEAARATLGRMRLALVGEARPGQPRLAQLMISHPNNSGLALDQVSRLYTPAHFVREVEVSLDGAPLMSADIDFSISENPNFRFWFLPKDGAREGELRARVVDSQDLRFESSLKLGTPP